jgi:hypothetical protein
VVNRPRRVFGPYSILKTQEMMVEALGPESPFEKVCKILNVERKSSGKYKQKRPNTPSKPIAQAMD